MTYPPIVKGTCEVCGTSGKVLLPFEICQDCHKAGIIWAARQAHTAANPPPAPAPPECPKSRTGRHEYLQVRGGHVCNACPKQGSG